MITLCLLIALAAIVYYYLHKDKETKVESRETKVESRESKVESEETKVESPSPKTLNRFIIWRDDKRLLYIDGSEAMLEYKNSRYSFGCQPYEPMTIIRKEDKPGEIRIHNSFDVNEECRLFKEQPKYFTRVISGHYYSAELFSRLLTAAIHYGGDVQIDDVEKMMLQQLEEEKGINALPYYSRDFKCQRKLYSDVDVLLGYFPTKTGKIYALAFNSPDEKGKEQFVYYLVTADEYEDYMRFPEARKWKNDEEVKEWYQLHLQERMILCNQFHRTPDIFIPFFTLAEING